MIKVGQRWLIKYSDRVYEGYEITGNISLYGTNNKYYSANIERITGEISYFGIYFPITGTENSWWLLLPNQDRPEPLDNGASSLYTGDKTLFPGAQQHHKEPNAKRNL